MQKIYYNLKPLLPRFFQLFLRRQRLFLKKLRYKNWLINDAASMTAKPQGWAGWPDGKKFALLLTHDVDTMRGHDRSAALADEEKKLGFRSTFFFVAQKYKNSPDLHSRLKEDGFEIGLHGLYHDHKTFESRSSFLKRAPLINQYLSVWKAQGFRAPSMICNLSWLHDLNIAYDASTYDFDPFEPQGGGAGTIFPHTITDPATGKSYVELPYTLPQDFTVFVLMREKNIGVYKKKLDWIARHGGMAHIITHPDYMRFAGDDANGETYPVDYYIEFLNYIKTNYEGQYWMALCRDMAAFVKANRDKQ